MVELASWICVFFLVERIGIEKDVLRIINWIVPVIQFHLGIDPMLSWTISLMVGFFSIIMSSARVRDNHSIQKMLRFSSHQEVSNLSVLSGHGS